MPEADALASFYTVDEVILTLTSIYDRPYVCMPPSPTMFDVMRGCQATPHIMFRVMAYSRCLLLPPLTLREQGIGIQLYLHLQFCL